MSPAAYVAVGAVRSYQWTIRPFIGANCRFFPSCSEYAIEAFREHGALRGGVLAGWRILRCNPWCPCGYDPVPPRLQCEAVQHMEGAFPLPLPGGTHNVRDTRPRQAPQPVGATGADDYGKSY